MRSREKRPRTGLDFHAVSRRAPSECQRRHTIHQPQRRVGDACRVGQRGQTRAAERGDRAIAADVDTNRISGRGDLSSQAVRDRDPQLRPIAAIGPERRAVSREHHRDGLARVDATH